MNDRAKLERVTGILRSACRHHRQNAGRSSTADADLDWLLDHVKRLEVELKASRGAHAKANERAKANALALVRANARLGAALTAP